MPKVLMQTFTRRFVGVLVGCTFLLTACAAAKSAENGTSQGGGEKLSDSIRQKKQGNEKVTEFDLNKDGKPDVWTYTVAGKSADGKDIDQLVRKELDINWDGKVDISRTYDDKELISIERLDLDFDGRIEITNFYEKGVRVRSERDLAAAGKPSEWVYYEKGKVVRKERDSNGDGKVDYWEYWEGDQVDRVGEDLDGDGNVDKWIKNPNSEG